MFLAKLSTISTLSASAVFATVLATSVSRAAPCQQPSPDAPPATLQTSTVLGMFERPDGTLGADGRNFLANFDASGATLRVVHPGDKEQLVSMTLRLRDWGRTDAPRQFTATGAQALAARRVGRDTVHYTHVDITECYVIQGAGFEQSFVLHERPAGHGDLVLGIAASSTALRAPLRSTAQQALEFHADGVPAVRYGEAVAFSRSQAGSEAARVPVATRYDGDGRIELVVPAAFLDHATYPVIIDPAVGPLQSPGGSGWVDADPDVAYDPREDVFICVWERRLSANIRVIRATRYLRNGTPLGALMFVSGSGFNRTPTVAYMGTSTPSFSGFYIVWGNTNGLQGQRVDSMTGSSVGGTQQLTTIPNATRDLRPALSIRGKTLVVAWDRTSSGSANPTQILARHVQLDDLPASTSTMGAEFVIETTTSGYVQRVRMPRTFIQNAGAEVRLCWERFYTFPVPGDYDVRTAFASLAGPWSAFIESPYGLPGASSIGTDERRPDVAQINSDPYLDGLVAYEDGAGIRGQRFSGAGLLGATFDIGASPALETEPAVGAGSTEFSVGYLTAPSSSGWGQNISAARVDTSGNVLAVDLPVNVLNGPLQRALRASSVVDTAGASTEPNGVMFGWLLERDSTGLVEDIRAQMFEPVQGMATMYGTACPGPGGTLPMIDVAGSPYPGNYDFLVQISNAPPNSLAALVIGDQFATLPIPGAPGCRLYMGLPLITALPVLTSSVGSGQVNLPIPVGVPPSVVLAIQWAVYTPGWNAFGWITSRDIDLAWLQ